MVRTQIYLNEKEYRFLRQEAFNKRSSVSAVLRKLVDERLPVKPVRKSAGLNSIVGMFKDKKSDVARCHNDYLAGIKE